MKIEFIMEIQRNDDQPPFDVCIAGEYTPSEDGTPFSLPMPSELIISDCTTRETGESFDLEESEIAQAKEQADITYSQMQQYQ